MEQKDRWWFKSEQKTSFMTPLSWPFFIIILLSFVVILAYQQISILLFGDKKDILTNDLGIIANYIRIYNTETANLVQDIDTVIKSYINDENIFEVQKKTIKRIWDSLTTQTEKIAIKDNKKYEKILKFFGELSPYQDELFGYAWSQASQSYLIILQNSSEKRPNGGFFGSFAYVRILHGKIRALHIIDSYLWLKTMPWVTIAPPDRSDAIYHNQSFWRITANKFWFTNIDGDHLIQLYNKTFNNPQSSKYIPNALCVDMCNRSIAWVIFVKTDVLKKLIPWLDKKTRERQFMNAAIDVIRGKNLPNKKEYYLSDSKEFFAKNQITLLRNFVSMFEELTSQSSFGIYIPTISTKLNELLSSYHFNTIPNNHTLYSRDTNKSFNKVDEFVSKTVTIRTPIGDIIREFNNNDQIDIHDIKPWPYVLTIAYSIRVPDQYKDFIRSLEIKNNIKLTDRELGILSMQPSTLFDNDALPRLWATRSQFYYPNTVEITGYTGDNFNTISFTTPFGKWLEYSLETAQNTIKKYIDINITIH